MGGTFANKLRLLRVSRREAPGTPPMNAPAPRAEFRALVNAVEDRVFEDIHDTADLIRSLAIGIREAAYRRDHIFIRIYRAEFREQAALLLGLIRDITARLEGEKTEAKGKGGAR